VRPYAAKKNPKGWKSMSKPHPNRRNKVRVDKKASRQQAKVSMLAERYEDASKMVRADDQGKRRLVEKLRKSMFGDD
jgi:hypothetical protein